MSTIKVDTIATRTGSGNITASNTVDLNGNELILDVDGDTSLTADTDDQIDNIEDFIPEFMTPSFGPQRSGE